MCVCVRGALAPFGNLCMHTDSSKICMGDEEREKCTPIEGVENKKE